MEYTNFQPIKRFNTNKRKHGPNYTQDGIMIYNIQAYTKNNEINFGEILEYFQSFSKNIKISLLNNYIYLIEFADSEDALKVLQKSEHIISKHLLYVEPCSSWLQPHIKTFVKYIDKQYNPNVYSSTITDDQIGLILKLNDDCLMEICEKLTLQDQINFALCCQRFCDIFQMISSTKYSYLDIEILTTLSCLKIKIFALIVGPYIKILKYYETRFSQLFCTFCPNIERLIIDCVVIENDLLTFFQVQMPKIKILELKFITWPDIAINHLKLFRNLKYLRISGHEVTGEYIASFVKLKELSLNECYYMEPNHFQDICKNLKNLKYLDIRYCTRLKSRNFQHILENLIKLETLKFTNTEENFNSICRLPELKVLEINSYNYQEFKDSFLQELVKHQTNQLLEFKMYNINLSFQQISLIAELKNLKVLYCCHNYRLNDEGLEKLSQLIKLKEIDFNNCDYISNKGILKLLEHCHELKKLNLVDCKLLSSDFISDILKLLQEQYDNNIRKDRIHLIIEDIDEFRNLKNEPGLHFPHHILKLSLKKVNPNYVFSYDGKRRRRRNDGTYICRIFFDRYLDTNTDWIVEN